MSTPFSQDWFTRIANQNNNKSKCPYLKEAIIKVVNMLKESNLRRDCGGGMNTITKIELTQEWETIVMHNLKAVEVSLSLLLGIFFGKESALKERKENVEGTSLIITTYFKREKPENNIFTEEEWYAIFINDKPYK